MDITLLNTAVVLGMLLGLRHATEADHIVAVSTVVSQDKNPWRGLWVGASWGLGHTTLLLFIGIVILLIDKPFPEDYAIILEFGVGLMLVMLGLQAFWSLRRREIHVHTHQHDGEAHLHFHSHATESPTTNHHGFIRLGRPEFRLKSYAIGSMHGLAGSAAVTLLVLATVDGFWKGLSYLLAFGVGTIMGMGLLTLLMGLPLAFTGRSERSSQFIKGLAGVASIAFGVMLMTKIGLSNNLLS